MEADPRRLVVCRLGGSSGHACGPRAHRVANGRPGLVAASGQADGPDTDGGGPEPAAGRSDAAARAARDPGAQRLSKASASSSGRRSAATAAPVRPATARRREPCRRRTRRSDSRRTGAIRCSFTTGATTRTVTASGTADMRRACSRDATHPHADPAASERDAEERPGRRVVTVRRGHSHDAQYACAGHGADAGWPATGPRVPGARRYHRSRPGDTTGSAEATGTDREVPAARAPVLHVARGRDLLAGRPPRHGCRWVAQRPRNAAEPSSRMCRRTSPSSRPISRSARAPRATAGRSSIRPTSSCRCRQSARHPLPDRARLGVQRRRQSRHRLRLQEPGRGRDRRQSGWHHQVSSPDPGRALITGRADDYRHRDLRSPATPSRSRRCAGSARRRRTSTTTRRRRSRTCSTTISSSS